jgi:hypothetical protein
MGILDEWCNFAEKAECCTTEVQKREQKVA